MTLAFRSLPNDGPVLRWALDHATRYIINLGDRQSFADEVSQFRNSRDRHQTRHESTNIPIRIEGLAGNLEMAHRHSGSNFIISVFGFSLDEQVNYGEELGSPVTKRLELSARGEMPLSMTEALIGQPASALIELPAPLQPIIASRTLLSVTAKPPNIHAVLSDPE